MYEKKQLVKSSLLLMLFWALSFSLYQAGRYPISEFVIPVIAIGFCIFTSYCAILMANYFRSRGDELNWINKTNFLSQSMRLLNAREVLANSGLWTKSAYDTHRPLEVSWDVVGQARSDIKGDYRLLFDEILSVFSGNLNVPAFIIPLNKEVEFNKQRRYLEYEISLAKSIGDLQEVESLESRIVELKQNTFEHDNRSLLKHSILVLAAAQKIFQYGGDPLNWPSFKRLGLEYTSDKMFLDPLIYICAFAHDIGKITAYNSKSKSVIDHDVMGARIVSSLPSYLNNSSIKGRDRLILDTVLGNYHAPHRIKTAINGTNPCVLDNRIHRVLEILILADKIAGKLEQKAYREGALQPLSEDEWRDIVLKNIGVTPSVRLTELGQKEKSELSESCVGAFIASLKDVAFNDDEDDRAVIQFDYESGSEFAYVDIAYMIELIEAKIGVLVCENQTKKESTYTELLAKEGKIVHPYNIDQRKNSWGWFFDFYDRSQLINEESGDISWGAIEIIKPLKVQQGPYWMVDPDSFEFQLKKSPRPFAQYLLLSGGLGNGVASAWVNHKKDIELKRQAKITASKESITQSISSEVAKEEDGDVFSRVISIKDLLGKGHQSDLKVLSSKGLGIQDIESLSLDEQVLVGLSVRDGKLKVQR